MQLIIKPEDESLEALLAANAYQMPWQEHEQALLAAFRDLTGLTFQQPILTVHTYLGDRGFAGYGDEPIRLPAYTDEGVKILILVHELCHRLLSGNILDIADLGMPTGEEDKEKFQEYEHRHTYLFLHDVVRQVLGDEWARRCQALEYDSKPEDDAHGRAWKWAMSLDFETRQRAIHRLAEHAITREHQTGHDGWPHVAKCEDPEAWFAALIAP